MHLKEENNALFMKNLVMETFIIIFPSLSIFLIEA